MVSNVPCKVTQVVTISGRGGSATILTACNPQEAQEIEHWSSQSQYGLFGEAAAFESFLLL